MTQLTTIFDPSNPAHRLVRSWTPPGCGRSWQREARAYARTHGEARVLLANGHCVRFWCEEGRIRQRTYRRVLMPSAAPKPHVRIYPEIQEVVI